MSSAALTVAKTANAYCVRVQGRCTMAQSPVLHEFATRVLEDRSQRLYVDLDQCTYLDSTFLGSLLDLHRKYGRTDPAQFCVVASSETRQRLLAPTHLHKAFCFADCLPEPLQNWVELCAEHVPTKMEMAQHIMECHRRLAEVDSPAQKTFAMIADQLERELAGQSPNATS